MLKAFQEQTIRKTSFGVVFEVQKQCGLGWRCWMFRASIDKENTWKFGSV